MLLERAFAIGAGVLAALGVTLVAVSIGYGVALTTWSFPIAGTLTFVFAGLLAFVAREARRDRLELVRPP